MNKSDLIESIALIADTPKSTAEKVLNATIESITQALAKGDSVALIGFGTFSVSERAARTGRNPQTGATIEIKASKNAAFKAGAALKTAVNS
jgi:DNA-binding protein HU-beta